MLAVYILAMSLPTLYLAYALQHAGWIMPVSITDANRPVPAAGLVMMFWAMVLAYSVFTGLMYGTRTALFMDVTTPAVAATQFTAYMAILNFAISYTAKWQGLAIERWGYPITLVLDAVTGVIGLVLLPWMAPRKTPAAELPPGQAIPEATPI
jgi:predicted MFS family arabinose efflux permease